MVADREHVDPATGEIFALVSLGAWQTLVALAERHAPTCPPGCVSCDLSRAVLAEDRDVRPLTHALATATAE